MVFSNNNFRRTHVTFPEPKYSFSVPDFSDKISSDRLTSDGTKNCREIVDKFSVVSRLKLSNDVLTPEVRTYSECPSYKK